jgi:TRAP transporter 4TM/12TM fusion protein
MFVILGAFLVASGITEVLTRIGLAASGRYVGGPAKVAAVASGMTGMISGTAAANVATTGTLTIPMMKRVGFPPHFAGAVEAIASTGGLIMPPIMGAAAFLIAEFVGIPYLTIMSAAILPALLFYASLLLVIHLRAARLGIGGLPAAQIPRLWSVLRRDGWMLLPIFLLIYLLIDGLTPTFAAMYALLAVIALSWLRPGHRIGPVRLVHALMRGAVAVVPVAMACLLAGIIIGVVSMTGVAQVFTSSIEDWAQGSLLIALLLTGIASILLSCALPATAVYIVVAVTVAPALIHMGAEALTAHFFVFWMGVLSNITPPVAIACFAAAGIAGASPSRIAFTALRFALPAFLLAIVFVYRPGLLLIDVEPLALARTVVFVAAGVAGYVIAIEGWLRGPLGWFWRLGFGGVALLCLAFPEVTTGWIGLAVMAALTGARWWVARDAAPPPPTPIDLPLDPSLEPSLEKRS